MAYMTNREFAVHEYNRQKRNAYADALVKEVRRLREENELLQKQLAEKIHIKLRTDEDMLTPKEAIETINRLRKAYRKTTAQLSASQRRENAAVEAVGKFARNAHTCISGDSPECHVKDDHGWCAKCPAWQWLDPQEAEKGDSNANG